MNERGAKILFWFRQSHRNPVNPVFLDNSRISIDSFGIVPAALQLHYFSVDIQEEINKEVEDKKKRRCETGREGKKMEKKEYCVCE